MVIWTFLPQLTPLENKVTTTVILIYRFGTQFNQSLLLGAKQHKNFRLGETKRTCYPSIYDDLRLWNGFIWLKLYDRVYYFRQYKSGCYLKSWIPKHVSLLSKNLLLFTKKRKEFTTRSNTKTHVNLEFCHCIYYLDDMNDYLWRSHCCELWPAIRIEVFLLVVH